MPYVLKVRTYTKGEYIYTETSYYDVYRNINIDYIKSSHRRLREMDDKLMDEIRAFQLWRIKRL